MERKHVDIENLRIKGVVNEFYRLKKDIDKEEKRNKERMGKSVERWEKPEISWLKVNCDGAMDIKSKVATSNVIVRNWQGKLVDGRNRKRVADNALMAEVWALKDGIELSIEKKWQQVIMEIDSKEL